MDIALRFDYGEDKLAGLPLEELIAFVLASRKLPQTTSVSVTFVSNERIHELNRDYRGIDKPTLEMEALEDELLAQWNEVKASSQASGSCE